MGTWPDVEARTQHWKGLVATPESSKTRRSSTAPLNLDLDLDKDATIHPTVSEICDRLDRPKER